MQPDSQPVPHSWQPRDLSAAAAAIPEATLGGLAYPGLRHLISGEPETGKTWLALILALLELKAGHAVFWFDFGEMGAAAIRERLAALGVTDEERDGLFFYFEPEEAIDDPARADLEQLIAEREPSLAVVDAYTGVLELHGLSPDKATDIQAFQRRLVAVLRRHGAAVVTLDHVVKDPEKRGKFSTGSERKLGAVEVHLGLEIIRPFGRGKHGLAKVLTKKDRPGWLPRPKAAEFELTANDDGTEATWALRLSDTGHDDDADEPPAFRPTTLMERVSIYLEASSESTSRNLVLGNVTGKDKYLRIALDVLAHEGYIRETPGARGASLYESLKPYRERDDLGPTSAPTAEDDLGPDLGPDEAHNQAANTTSAHLGPTSAPTSADDLGPVALSPSRGEQRPGRSQEAADDDPPGASGGQGKGASGQEAADLADGLRRAADVLTGFGREGDA